VRPTNWPVRAAGLGSGAVENWRNFGATNQGKLPPHRLLQGNVIVRMTSHE
jgi:hypothetical protein